MKYGKERQEITIEMSPKGAIINAGGTLAIVGAVVVALALVATVAVLASGGL